MVRTTPQLYCGGTAKKKTLLTWHSPPCWPRASLPVCLGFRMKAVWALLKWRAQLVCYSLGCLGLLFFGFLFFVYGVLFGVCVCLAELDCQSREIRTVAPAVGFTFGGEEEHPRGYLVLVVGYGMSGELHRSHRCTTTLAARQIVRKREGYCRAHSRPSSTVHLTPPPSSCGLAN